MKRMECMIRAKDCCNVPIAQAIHHVEVVLAIRTDQNVFSVTSSEVSESE
uniref:AlNc14C298G10349 protein n=1 Tax=Albugo laibachii Nc14 TaxID=890382 RepID=F0WVL4_9STRA|nr:AlNc14C298G10349 [Albugo laibachii Nc14]|eukprot:CCA25456.1 AlNc14C298G10349 [Albugo laibachii Nc14]